jgi:putative ABC transport system substrate-binding protein
MRRRSFITLLGGAAVAWPLAAGAQQSERMRHIGVLMGWPESDPEARLERAAFVQELQKLGWLDGRNLRIDTRWANPADPESMHRYAKELVALQPDLILSHSTPATAALLQETRTIPVIFGIVADPIGSGFVASFPRPGGNATGFAVAEPTQAGKWMELLKEIAPRVTRSLCCLTHQRRHLSKRISAPLKLPLRLLAWRLFVAPASGRTRASISGYDTGSRAK